MLGKALITNRNGSNGPQQKEAPRPGDFELGSLESRAAARAMLDGRYQPRCRVTVHRVGGVLDLTGSTCVRSTWPNGTICEFVRFDGDGRQVNQARLDQIIGKLPIDGKEYTLEATVSHLGHSGTEIVKNPLRSMPANGCIHSASRTGFWRSAIVSFWKIRHHPEIVWRYTRPRESRRVPRVTECNRDFSTATRTAL